MSPQEVTERAEKIRSLIIKDDLETVFPLLLNLTKETGGNYSDESINLYQDYTKLNNEIRNGFLTPTQAETNRNLLIDRVLKLIRLIEKNDEKPNIGFVSTGKSKRLLSLLGLCVAGVLLFFYLRSHNTETVVTPPPPAEDKCVLTTDEGIAAFKEGNLDKAERIFISAKAFCADTQSIQIWLEQTTAQRQRTVSTETSTDVVKPIENTKTNEKPSSNPVNPARKKPIVKIPETNIKLPDPVVPIKPTFPDAMENKEAIYKAEMKKGYELFIAKNYPEAYISYTLAKAAQNTDEVRSRLSTVIDLCYRQFFSKGMDYYNAKDYNKAALEFEKAKSYKNILQVRSMIEKCQATF